MKIDDMAIRMGEFKKTGAQGRPSSCYIKPTLINDLLAIPTTPEEGSVEATAEDVKKRNP